MAFEPIKESVVVCKEKKVSVASCNVDVEILGGEIPIASVLSARCEMESFCCDQHEGAVNIDFKVRFDCVCVMADGQIKTFNQYVEKTESVKTPQNQNEYYARYTIGKVSGGNGVVGCEIDFDVYEIEKVELDYISPTSSGLFVKDAHQQYYSVENKGVSSTNISCDEGSLEWDVQYLNARCVVKDVIASDGYFTVSGEVLCDVMLGGDRPIFKTVKTPFSEECVCECKSEDVVDVYCKIRKVETERMGNTEGEKLVISFDIDFEYVVQRLCEFNYVADAFCVNSTLLPSICSSELCVDKKRAFINDRIDFTVEISTPEIVDEIWGACDFVVELAQSKIEHGKLYVEGVVFGRVLCANENGVFSIDVASPFASAVKTCLDCDCVDVNAQVCEVSTRLKRGNELTVACELTYCVKCENNESVAIINEFNLGDEIENRDGVLSIVIGREGEGLFDVARCACCDPALITTSNPDIKFPLVGGERIIVFKDKTCN